jgi:hypothetical protein
MEMKTLTRTLCAGWLALAAGAFAQPATAQTAASPATAAAGAESWTRSSLARSP